MASPRSTLLTLARTGGVAGIRPPPFVLDTARLPKPELSRIETLIEQSRFFSLPAELPAEGPGADRFLHHLTIRHADGRTHTVTFTEGAANNALRALKRLVRDAATKA